MSAPSLPDAFRHLTCLAEIRGDGDAQTLRAALSDLDRLPPDAFRDLVDLARAPGVRDLPGLPRPVADRLRHWVSAGADAAAAAARARIPVLHQHLLERRAVTHEQAVMLARELGVVTLTDLLVLMGDERRSRLPIAMQERLADAAGELSVTLRPTPLGRAFEILDQCRQIVARAPGVDEVAIAGDVRRFEPLAHALVLTARATHPPDAVRSVVESSDVEDVRYRAGRRAVVSLRGTEVDVRVAAHDEFGTMLFAATGSVEHLAAMRRRHGVDLCAREQDVYARAGLPWIPPEMRNGSGEVEAAAAGRLPRLVERRDIRGDLHMHSTYSDGQDTIESMVRAAAALGYEYVAITDHSENAAASRTVTPDQLARQRDEIERLRPLFPGLEILHGLEVDILPDGRLDAADAILEPLDIVLASLHEAAGQDGPTLTRRCLRAIAHPLVNVITHPANQLVGRRPGYQLDYEAVYEAARESGTALEIDGAPSHLDLDGAHARAAVEAGATVTIDSDCHRAAALERQMTFGIGTARRGWVEPRSVLNTRPLVDVRAFVAAKRARRM